MSVAGEKSALRAALRARVAAMGESDRKRASEAVRRGVLGSSLWAEAGVVMVFASDATEPDLDGLIHAGVEAGKVVCVPRVHWAEKRLLPARVRGVEDLETGRHGVRVPVEACPLVDPGALGLILVPGVGFDLGGGRLGRGGGFYDRLLSDRSISALAIGVCFSAQVVGEVPREAHDRRMDGLATEAGLVICGFKEESG